MLWSEHMYCVAVTFKMTKLSNESTSNFALSLNIPVWKLLDDSEGCSYGQPEIGSFPMTMPPVMHHISCRVFGETSNHPGHSVPYSQDLVPCDFRIFPKLKSPLKGKRFQTVNEIKENTTGHLMVTGRTVWGPKVPTLKGTEVSVSYVQLFLCLVSSSINVSIFPITWLDTFWADLVFLLPILQMKH